MLASSWVGEDLMGKLAIILLAAAGPALISTTAQPASAPAPATPAGTVVEKLDPTLDALITPDAKVEILHQDDQFFEGPVWHHGADGNFLTFSDLISNRVDKWDPATMKVTT